MKTHICQKWGKCGVPMPGKEYERFEDCYAQYQWNKKMARLLAKEPKSMKDFTFIPKGEGT